MRVEMMVTNYVRSFFFLHKLLAALLLHSICKKKKRSNIYLALSFALYKQFYKLEHNILNIRNSVQLCECMH